MGHQKRRYAAVLAAMGVLAMTPGAALAQGPVEQSDDLPLEEEMAPVYDNTIFHTDQGGDYKSDGGSGVESSSTFHSDDTSQSLSASETVVNNVAVEVTQSYDQLADRSVNDYSVSSDSGGTSLNYTRDREDNDASLSVTAGDTTVSESAPTVEIMTGYQLYDTVF